jgi:hypothetical protein
MPISLAGSMGIGIVWGWVSCRINKASRLSMRGVVTLSLASLLEALAIFLLIELQAAISYLFALPFGFIIHFTWHARLRRSSKV